MICTPLELETERAQTVHHGSGTNLFFSLRFPHVCLGVLWNLPVQSGVWSQLWLIRHPGLKAQVYVVCKNIDSILTRSIAAL